MRKSILAALLLPLFILSGLAASAQTSNSADKARRKAINDYLLTKMRPRENKTSLTRSITSAAEVPYIKDGKNVFFLEKHEHDAEKEPFKDDNFFTEDNPKIFPGALLWADQYLADGDPRPVTGLGEGTVDVFLDIDTGGDTFIVENVPMNYGDIKKAASKLVRQLYDSGYKQPGRIRSISDDYSSTEELCIKANIDVKFAAKFSASMSTSKSATTITHLEDFSQIYYNVIVRPHKGDMSYLFGPEVTAQDIENECRQNGYAPIVLVNQVTYGRRLYLLNEYRAKDFKLNYSANGSYSGVSASTTGDITSSSKASSRKVYICGGDPPLGVGLIQDKSTISKILAGKDDALTMSKVNQGVSMSYMAEFIGNRVTAKRGTIGKYYTYDYVPATYHVHTIWRNNCTHIAGGDIKIRMDYKVYTINSKGKKVYKTPEKGVEQGYTRWVEKHTNWKSKDEFDLNLAEGEYVEPEIRFQIRYKPSLKKKWQEAIVGTVVPDKPGSGTIDVDIRGHVATKDYDTTKPYIYSQSYTTVTGAR